jgi:crossover junction endodeoxyribonuclease RuvC
MWTEKLSSCGGENFTNRSGTAHHNSGEVHIFKGTAIGIDPSLRGTGVAVVNFSETTPRLMFSSRIACHRSLSFFQCIEKIFTATSDILGEFSVDCAAIEQTIYVQNYRVSHSMGAAKGAIIAALMRKNLTISEYEPLRVKMSVVGVGRAPKEQIRRTVCGILNIGDNISYDESDAVAVALCHGWASKLQHFQ